MKIALLLVAAGEVDAEEVAELERDLLDGDLFAELDADHRMTGADVVILRDDDGGLRAENVARLADLGVDLGELKL